MARVMSDTEIRHRKKVQAGISQAGGALGLTALGGTMLASRGGRNTLRKIPQLKSHVKAPPPKDPNRDRIKGAITPVLATGAGLGGVGSFNFAAYTKAESKKRQKPAVVGQPPSRVKKREDEPMEMGYYGEVGRPVLLTEIEVPVSKAWQPSAGNFDSENARKKRTKGYQGAALVGAGAGGAYAGHHGMKAAHAAGKIKPVSMGLMETRTVDAQGTTRRVPKVAGRRGSKKAHVIEEKAIPTKALKAAGKHGGRTALGVGAVAAAAGTHRALKRKEKSSWQPYAKRNSASAFGINHA
jgi:hypothetical protein